MTPLDTFARLVAADRPSVPLLESAAALALYADPDCNPQHVARTVHEWGGRLARRVPADSAPAFRLRLLNHFFFDELGFGPRSDLAPEAADSYLHCALVRRTGLPITLSVLYVEIGRAIGLRLAGISFPGHFLVRAQVPGGTHVIDVYERGATLSTAALKSRLQQARGRGAAATPPTDMQLRRFLRPATDREILARMLRNLKFMHVAAADWDAVLEVQHRLLALLPDAADELRDRAATYERLECPRGAARDLAQYLRMVRQPADAAALRSRLRELQAEARALH